MTIAQTDIIHEQVQSHENKELDTDQQRKKNKNDKPTHHNTDSRREIIDWPTTGRENT